MRWIREFLDPGDTFFDVGAHHGWMSLSASARVGSTGKVIAFEPVPVLAKLLTFHKRMNRLRQLNVVRKAVSSHDQVNVPFFAVRGGDSFLNALVFDPAHLESESPSVIRVDTITLDSFCSTQRCKPTLIKIDVEGAELLALQGARKLLAEQHPTLIVAVHPPWLPRGQHESDLFGMLSTLGYEIAESYLVPYGGTTFGDYLCC